MLTQLQSGLPVEQSWLRTIRPIGAYSIQSMTTDGDELLVLDTIQGYVLRVNRQTDGSTILNPHLTGWFLDATGLALADGMLWFTRDERVYRCPLQDLQSVTEPQIEEFVRLPYFADGVAVWQSTVYVSCQRAGYIFVFNAQTGKQITKLTAPGVGIENLTVRDEELWVCDRVEQTVYCMDRATGKVHFSVLTPFENPTALVFCPDSQTHESVLYVAYAGEEMYVRESPNQDPPYELANRDRTFIHPLYFRHYPEERYSLSNGYLVEMTYAEELSPLEEIQLDQVEWRIALPSETHRQQVRSIEPIGLPFTEEVIDGQRVALFKFDSLKPGEKHIFGWKALLEVWSIKYSLTPRQLENLPELPANFQERYLVDNDELSMDTPIIQSAAKEAIGTETNLLRQILRIRNYVYDRLSYGIKPHIDTPDVALERGVGSCGEYLGVLLAISRLNGIACRTVGRYKCPRPVDRPFVTLQPDYNHVWMEFYAPGFGWLPMESNPDDVVDGGPYPTRFFMGLAWFHTEIGKGISFETVKTSDPTAEISIGELSLNHIRFKILAELQPPEIPPAKISR